AAELETIGARDVEHPWRTGWVERRTDEELLAHLRGRLAIAQREPDGGLRLRVGKRVLRPDGGRGGTVAEIPEIGERVELGIEGVGAERDVDARENRAERADGAGGPLVGHLAG